jgi:iron-sulfur cluster repair protein YtfE (RIC family)
MLSSDERYFDVDYMSILADLFQQEDQARAMAHQLMEIANHSREAAARERASLLEFLHGPMERHMEYEERSLFPRLTNRGLGAEVSVAEKQHTALREQRARLEAIPQEEVVARGGEVAQLIFDIARLMLHHTNFEGDYIYPELDKHDWAELMEETIH